MKSKTFIIDNLIQICQYTLNKIDRSTLEEAIEFQCYRLDLECIIVEPDYNDSYKRPIAIIPSMKLIDIVEVLNNSEANTRLSRFSLLESKIVSLLPDQPFSPL